MRKASAPLTSGDTERPANGDAEVPNEDRPMRAMLFALSLSACGTAVVDAPAESPDRSELFYGNDDRLDVYQVSDPALLAAADATVALMDSSDVTRSGNGYDLWTGWSLRNSIGVCNSEPFATQPTTAECSAVLVGDDLVATAGHCISSSSCNGTRIVFNYQMNSANSVNDRVGLDDVYSCDNIVARSTGTADWAVVQLDRPVVGHTPVAIRRSGTVGNSAPLVLMGFPAGLPLKIAGGANVKRNSASAYFESNVDSYGGNSGSPVFNANTMELEGILVRGNNDWVRSGGCFVSDTCANSGCPGWEDSTRVTLFDQHIPDGPTTPPPASCTDDAQEPNDSQNSAAALDEGAYDLEVCGAGDDDWYSIDLTAGETVEITMSFTHAQGDLDMELFQGNTSLGVSESVDNVESLTYTATSATTVDLQVYGYNDAENSYSLDIDLRGGTPTAGDAFALGGLPSVDRGDWYSFTITDAPVDERLYVYVGNPNTSSTIPRCGSVPMDIGNRTLVGRPWSDAAGNATLTVQIPTNLATGTYNLQAASAGDCSTSNIFQMSVQ